MDEADMAAERAEREAPYLLRASVKPVGPKPTGFCLYCAEPLADTLLRFCPGTSECRDGFEYEERRRAAAGGNRYDQDRET